MRPIGVWKDKLLLAAEAISNADAIYITAGAGMGVDSGLPDFRGNEGFWNAYPPMKKLGLSFIDCANPEWFFHDPEFAWGFYGHRLQLYRDTVPHEGFSILKKWSDQKKLGGFVFTSNVDGQFQKSGFSEDQVYECHGSIHFLQCAQSCSKSEKYHDRGIQPADQYTPKIDMETFKMDTSDLPSCPVPGCTSSISRPNILMFGDWYWNHARSSKQDKNKEAWFQKVQKNKANLVTIELGAGKAVPTVRMESENTAYRRHGTLVRVNKRESEINSFRVKRGISIAEGALASLEAIDALM